MMPRSSTGSRGASGDLAPLKKTMLLSNNATAVEDVRKVTSNRDDDNVSVCSRASSRSSTSSRASLSSTSSSMVSASCKSTSSGSKTREGTSIASSRSRSSLSTVTSIQALELRKLEIEAQLKEVESALEQKQTSGSSQVRRPFALLPRSR
ncbi:hypothetical protein H310_11870 [Aphanomyces invadans]|uniref:Uncharacterized protein n=1 Tax=Aphanomyces invadans TaxID=157072 RepID=A0A024TKS4_9STRA|nr:hypothetical protein H310_11870 [Aphanomyces invadans]ETV94609.1 hypothetical protein H310_11870 [Aphanomyces invadans]|eukprot:XP_008876924.1 hypothetical protein H310_11870 [Aphanomyces invadans]